ncbi:hypothetical protein LAJ19_21585 (plasmid) [Deinococcus taeanensis]|uniref:protein DpdE n=1 Tax=Deinococcus taeanensis TaxID=2737050 RepID=UPI001CDB9D5F|nr:protein DpdE [Deinococcus taeanensis]UBV45518.1 hypothetical protein LAJ19_21585 [Deinococcus taeanensis]
MSLIEGQLVIHTAAPELGPAKLQTLYRDEARLLYMDSIAQWREVTVPVSEVKRVNPWPQNRVYVKESGNTWRMGRIIYLRTEPREGFDVRFPNNVERQVPEKDVYLRARGDANPMDVLKLHGHETPYFFERRWPLVEAFQQQWSACRGLTSLLSSAVDLRDHQVNTVRRVLQDSVPRYLLADEVGLGKTIESGLIMRQVLLDRPGTRVTCLVPPHLVKQWTEELRSRFYIDDFGDAVTILPHGTHKLPPSDFIVIDEAHHVAALAFTSRRPEYEHLARWTAQAGGLLLLSATPAASDQRAFLGMLHLLEPQVYALQDEEAFKLRLREREQIGSLFYVLDASLPKALADGSVQAVGDLFPGDTQVQHLVQAWNALPVDETESQRRSILAPLRMHVSETYRLHRRMIRHRRDTHAQHLVRGRQNGPALEVHDPEMNAAWALLDQWRETLATCAESSGGAWPLDVMETLLEGAMAGPAAWRQAVTRLQVHPQIRRSPSLLSGLNAIEHALPASDPGLMSLLERTVRQFTGKIVIFSGSDVQAVGIANQLAQQLGAERVTSSMKGDQEVQRFATSRACQVLIADRAGEEGLNLQCADLLVHLDLPVNANRLEQRLGRLDRYSRGKPVTSRVVTRSSWLPAMRQYVAFQNEVGVFDRSVASLLDLMDTLRAEVMTAFLNGDYALKELTSQLGARLEAERIRVEEAELLDTIDEEQDQDLSRVMDDLYESEAVDFSGLFCRWVISALKFNPKYSGDTFQLQFDDRQTLVNWERIREQFKPVLGRHGTFSRKVAQGCEGHLLRLGDPFVNAIAEYLNEDDRGRSYAFWRVEPTWNQEDLIAFGLHFIVKPDPGAALRAARHYRLNPDAVTRRLSGLLGPRTFTIYVDHHGRPVPPEALRLLQKSYDQTDYNLSSERVHALEALLPQRDWEQACDLVLQVATTQLKKDQALQEHLSTSLQGAQTSLERQYRQWTLRHDAHRPDVSSTDLKRERTLHEALLTGISAPLYHLDAVGVRVLSHRNPFQ